MWYQVASRALPAPYLEARLLAQSELPGLRPITDQFSFLHPNATRRDWANRLQVRGVEADFVLHTYTSIIMHTINNGYIWDTDRLQTYMGADKCRPVQFGHEVTWLFA